MTIKPDKIIVLCLDQSIEMIIAILGVLKSGAAYVPVSMHYPDARIHYIINDTKTLLLLTQLSHIKRLKKITSKSAIGIDDCNFDNLSSNNLNVPTMPDHLAYVIYTSGTTGKPKGVMQTHYNILKIINKF